MMDVRDTVGQALAALAARKLRTALTLLGLIIGVSSLILVMTIIQGANTYVKQKIANLGTDVFEVSKLPLATTNFNELVKALRNKDLVREEWQAVAAGCSLCRAVGAVARTKGRVRSATESLADVEIRGESPEVSSISSLDLVAGRSFTPSEDEQAARVCVLGDNVLQELFPSRDPLEQHLRIGGEEFRVIGVAERIGSILGQEQDTFVIIPLSTFQKFYGSRVSLTLKVQVRSEADLARAQEQVRTLLRGQRQRDYDEPDDFYMATAETYLALWEGISSVFFLVFVLISSIASLVGGIVIMNIMLVSVTERTKEIGLRRSVGATRRDILKHFLLEALTLCLVGGVIGVGVGFVVAVVLRTFTPFPADVRLWVAFMGFALSSAIALIFGLYPAMQAARLDPAVALRAE
ncbi:MAG: ABC transporter permease [Acidobacteria bacterium]|nr:ABC transporter permease [Acidobacteriota bacterium]